LIAKAIESPDAMPAKTVWQVYRLGDSGETAAATLAARLAADGITVKSTTLAADDAPEVLATRLTEAGSADAIVLWLRPDELKALPPAPPSDARIFMSGLMGGLEGAPLPIDWRSATHMAYPFDLPERRRVRVDYALGWFTLRHIPIVALQVQADTYLACGLLSETLSHMADTFARDYLIERTEDTLDHRVLTGYYPRLALAPGQRFASKGGYLVHLAEAPGMRVAAEGDWMVP
jgi:hypothetical protein